MTTPNSLGILLFHDVEVLDFAGPFEVFSLAETDGVRCFDVKTVSQDGGIVEATGGLKVQPDYSFETAPPFDALVVPGGRGARVSEVNNPATLDWIGKQSDAAQIVASVCTGAFLLAKTGLLDGKAATTHWAHTDALQSQYPSVEVRPGVGFVDQGRVITSVGISAIIHMSLHVVKRLAGRDAAQAAAKRMEYEAVF